MNGVWTRLSLSISYMLSCLSTRQTGYAEHEANVDI